MDGKVLSLKFASSITDLCEINSSFARGILRIAYAGANRNGSFISKNTFEKCIKTIYNCPIVCNYDRETGTLGGHDMDIVKDKDGRMVLVNLTTPVGCIPESAKIFWENVTEDDGTTHEYLCTEALLWKRQEACKKIMEDGITAHSMEITVKEGHEADGIYYIDDFEFTAFALIGVTPCFESSSLEVFSENNFKKQFSEMMHELKESFNSVKTSEKEDNNIFDKTHPVKGGEQTLDKSELIAKYEINTEELDFSVDDYSAEELEEKFKAIKAEKDKESEKAKYALVGEIAEELCRSLGEIKLQREWGECDRYIFVDFDIDEKEVYCHDCSDWLLYGFAYAMDGDRVIIDFDSKKRKKYVIADFDEGENTSPFAPVFEMMEQKIKDGAEWKAKYEEVSATIDSVNSELDELRKFKTDTENTLAQEKVDEVFARFNEELSGVEAFEALKVSWEGFDSEALEEKCYAIKGRMGQSAKFSHESKTPKLPVEKTKNENLPYGGVFEKYGISAEN